jgi:hypothetical protein
MEQHPVPQNVTTFQFRLIGDMTLKQFGYLAGGAVVAYLCYKLPLPLFLNWPLAITSALAGFGFAFVPIEERPMDVWVLSFFKSIYSPTQYTWTKQQPQPQAAVPTPQPASPAGITKKGAILNNIFTPPPAAPAATQKMKSPGFMDRFFDMLMPKPVPTQPVASVPAPQVAFPSTVPVKMDFTPPPTVRAREEAVEEKIVEVKRELADKTQDPSRAAGLQQQVADLVAQRDKMEAEIARLKLQSEPPAPPKPGSTYVATPAAKAGPSVRIITPDRAVKVGLPRLTTFPNVVTGIVKDGDQNLLPGVLITVKDKEGVPVRALKTNRLGQFAASTPLTNGTYFVEIEDPRLRYAFDRAQITLNGSIVPALEIFAKSQKEITRAKLEKELFGDKKNLTNPANKPI